MLSVYLATLRSNHTVAWRPYFDLLPEKAYPSSSLMLAESISKPKS